MFVAQEMQTDPCSWWSLGVPVLESRDEIEFQERQTRRKTAKSVTVVVMQNQKRALGEVVEKSRHAFQW